MFYIFVKFLYILFLSINKLRHTLTAIGSIITTKFYQGIDSFLKTIQFSTTLNIYLYLLLTILHLQIV